MCLIFGISLQLTVEVNGRGIKIRLLAHVFLFCQTYFPPFHGHAANLADKVNIGGINSITQTLEKWGNSIFWQMKHILLNNPESLLPEISR